MEITELRCNGRKFPINVTDHPVFSCKFDAEDKIVSRRLIISASEDFCAEAIGNVYDSLECAVDGVYMTASPRLKPLTRYFYRFCAKTESGEEAWSEVSHFDAGLTRGFDRRAQWIGTDAMLDEDSDAAERFRRDVTLKAEDLPHCKAAICCVGFYELYINGERVRDAMMTQPRTDTQKIIYYDVLDLSSYLHEGANSISLIVAKLPNVRYFAPSIRLLFQLSVGTRVALYSDTRWKASAVGGEITCMSYDYCECIDLRKATAWMKVGAGRGFASAAIQTAPGGVLTPFDGGVLRYVETVDAVDCDETDDGLVFDFGKTVFGNCRVTVIAPRGSEIEVKYMDGFCTRDDSCDSTSSLGAADGEAESIESTDTEALPSLHGETDAQSDTVAFDVSVQNFYHTSKRSEPESLEPHFLFQSFRAVCIKGVDADHVVSVEADAYETAYERIGAFECSDPTVAALYRCGVDFAREYWYGQLPQARTCVDTDDGTAFMAAASVYDMNEFVLRMIRAFASEQLPSGQIPSVIACEYVPFARGEGIISTSHVYEVVYAQWLIGGDDRIALEAYPVCKKYVDFLQTLVTRNLLKHGASDVDDSTQTIIDSCAYIRLISMTAHFARVLGKSGDAARLNDAAARTRKAVAEAYVAEEGFVEGNAALAYAAVLQADAVPIGMCDACVKRFDEAVQAEGFRLACGSYGARNLLTALVDCGLHDTVAQVFETKGACSMEALSQWIENGSIHADDAMYLRKLAVSVAAMLPSCAAGLRPIEQGFKRFAVAPKPSAARLTSLRYAYDCPYGHIGISWIVMGGKIRMTVEVPNGTVCTATLPSGEVFELGAGTHQLSD